MVAVGGAARGAGDQDDAAEDDRDRDERAPAGPLAEERPGDERDEHDLRVAEHGAEPGADVLDRVVPEDEVGAEEDAGGDGEQPLAAAARPERPLLDARGDEEQRHGERAAEERARRGRDVGEAEEDRREGDAEGAERGGDARPSQHRRTPREERDGHDAQGYAQPRRPERARARRRPAAGPVRRIVTKPAQTRAQRPARLPTGGRGDPLGVVGAAGVAAGRRGWEQRPGGPRGS